MEENIVITLLEERDVKQVNDLYNSFYKANRTTEKFNWEFRQCPCGKAIYVVAKDVIKNKIIGTQCAIPLLVNTPKGEVLTAKSEDTLVDPNYRGQKIFERMYALLFEECKKNGINIIWGFTYAEKPFKKIGFETPFKSKPGILIFNHLKSYNYLVKLNFNNTKYRKFLIFLFSTYSWIRSFKSRMSPANSPYSIIEKEERDLNTLLKEATGIADKMFYLKQDNNFLTWRIYNNAYPLNFLQYSLYDKDHLVGNLIASIDERGLVYIIQFVIESTLTKKIKQDFIKSCLKRMQLKKPFMIRFMGFDHNDLNQNEVNLLKKAGFVFNKQGITFVWKVLNENTSINPQNFILSRMSAQGTN